MTLIQELENARKTLSKLTFKKYKGNKFNGPCICDNIEDINNRIEFGRYLRIRKHSINVELGYGYMYNLTKLEFNEVQKVRLLFLDILIEHLKEEV